MRQLSEYSICKLYDIGPSLRCQSESRTKDLEVKRSVTYPSSRFEVVQGFLEVTEEGGNCMMSSSSTSSMANMFFCAMYPEVRRCVRSSTTPVL